MKPKFKVETTVTEHCDEYERRFITIDKVEPKSVSLECPHCGTFATMSLDAVAERGFYRFDMICSCPTCEKSVFVQAEYNDPEIPYENADEVPQTERVTAVYPEVVRSTTPPEVPERYAREYKEARLTLRFSPKASAALSRRILQGVLRDSYYINTGNLAEAVDAFLKKEGIPSYLIQAIDAIRNIGNFAAHPSKDQRTGEIVDVEPGEAEWLIDVLDALFDFTFVQPRRLKERRNRLDQKLSYMNKPQMK